MASDGNGDNDITPLLEHLISPRQNPPQHHISLPENNDVAIPMPMSPSEFKDRVIVGHSPRTPRHSSLLADSLSQNASSSSFATRPTTSFTDSSTLDLLLPPLFPLISEPNLPFINPKSTRPGFHRSKTAPPMPVINNVNHPSDKRESSDSKSIVRQAIALFIVYLSLGVFIYWWNIDHYVMNKTHPVVDALYICIVSMRTIGSGDMIPNTVFTKLFSILFVLVGFGFINILLRGMLTHVLDLQESYILEDASKTLHEPENLKSYIIDVRTGRMRIRFKVVLALGVVVLCIGFGTLIMHFIEEIDWLDSFYFSVMSVTTVGCGDRAFKTMAGRLIASIWLLVSTLAVARAFLFLAEARIDKRNRQRAKTVLDENMSVSQFFAADINHYGCVSKADFVIYKLMEMKKITERDTKPIVKQFDKLDRSNCGYITLADVIDPNTE